MTVAPSRRTPSADAPSLIAPEELLDQGWTDRTLLDVRWRLGGPPGEPEFERGHIPGAVFVSLPEVLAGPPGAGGRHPLPEPGAFAAAMREAGVGARRPVVVYDDSGGLAAARAWWLLRHHGHPDVRVLDGGWSWWVRLGGPRERGASSRRTGVGDFEAGPGALGVVDAAGAAEIARRGLLVDARAAERFRGETEPVDPVAGHVPGAVNIPTSRNLAGGDRAGRLASREELAETYRQALVPGLEVAVYCGSGVTAAHDIWALHQLGVEAGLYAGSWSEWVTDHDRPVATG